MGHSSGKELRPVEVLVEKLCSGRRKPQTTSMRSVQKLSSHMLRKRHLLKKIHDARNIVHKTMTSQSPSKQIYWDLTQFYCHQLPCCSFLNFIVGLKSLHFQRWFQFWEKPEVTGHQIWLLGLSHLGDLMFCKNSAREVIPEWAGCCDKAANHQLPIAVAF